jgi:hypothetical protein
MIQGLLVLNNPTYIFEPWHGTLLVIAITAFCIIFNTFLAKKLPMVEGLVLIIHILGFFAVLIPLWVLAPRTDAKTVFTEFTNREYSFNSVCPTAVKMFERCLQSVLSFCHRTYLRLLGTSHLHSLL